MKLLMTPLVLAACLATTSAWAAPEKNQKKGSDNHFCLSSVPGSQSPTRSLYRLSYSDLQNGHMVISGELCYSFPPHDPADPKQHDCFPVIGAGMLFEDKVEIVAQSAEFTPESGTETLFSGEAHLWLDVATFKGTYNRIGEAWIGGQQVEYSEQGTVEPIKCPTRTGEKALDKRFANAVKKFDKQY